MPAPAPETGRAAGKAKGMTAILWRGLPVARRIGLALILALTPLTGMAQQVIVIGDDRGGRVAERARLVDQIREAHARVEIRGRVCYSACTMYLGAGDVCVSPATTFGFHGPSRDGRALSRDDLDHWSAVMARYYVAPLRDWYMTTARHRHDRVERLSGADLIRLGYPAC